MKLSPRELELLHGLPDQGQSSAQPAPTENEFAKAAQEIGAQPAELARLHSRLAADEILRQRVYSLQEWDRQLAAALPRVAVPVNLELQLRQTLALAEPDVEQAPPSSSESHTKTSRRRWLRGLVAGGTAAAIGYFSWLNWPRSRTLEQSELAEASSWLDRYLRADRWSDADWPFEEFPLPAVVRPEPFGWQSVAAELQTPAVAYNYSTSDGQRAALFVIPQPAGTFTTRVPFRPQTSTQGRCVGHWQHGPHLMVLVVEGNESRYRLFWRPERAVPVV